MPVRQRDRELRIEFDLTVSPELQAFFDNFGGEARVAAAKAVFREAHHIRNIAIPLTPIDTGALRRSYFVDPPQISGDQVFCETGCGGPSAPYAIEVHERVELYHRPPTRAKFLEEALNRAEPGMTERAVAIMRQELF